MPPQVTGKTRAARIPLDYYKHPDILHTWQGRLGWIALIVPLANPGGATTIHGSAAMAGPGAGHLLGTDQFGRDVLARILYGGRIDLAIAFGATIVTLVGGTIIGLVAGYLGGRWDSFLMRIVDLFFAHLDEIIAIQQQYRDEP